MAALGNDLRADGMWQGDLHTFLSNAMAIINELQADHATFRTVVEEIKATANANLTDGGTLRAVLAGVISGSATWDPGSLADGVGETSAAITATGAALGDFVLVSAPYDLQGITCNGYVSATSQVKIRLQNESTATVDLASGTWRVRVIPQASFAAPSAATASAVQTSSPATLTASTALTLSKG